MQNSLVSRRSNTTYEIRTGYKSPAHDPKVVAKRKSSILRHYGVEHNWSSKELRENSRKKYEERTGYRSPSSNPEVVAKKKATMLERYGVESALRNDELMQK